MSIQEDGNTQWGKLSADYLSNTWSKEKLEIPFLEAQFKRFAERKAGAPWKALDVGCGMGKYSLKLLQAGASYLLANDISADMVAGAKKEIDGYLLSQSIIEAEKSPEVDVQVCNVKTLSSTLSTQQGTFDLAICIYVLCNLCSKEEVKHALLEISKMLKIGGKLMFYESHITFHFKTPMSDAFITPKVDGTEWKYFEDEGKPRTVQMKMKSGKTIEFVNRYYTLSFLVASFLEAGFQITQFLEPRLNQEDVPADAIDSFQKFVDIPSSIFWELTKVTE